MIGIQTTSLIALCKVFTENISTARFIDSFLPLWVSYQSAHILCYISLDNCFVGAQNCWGINYENTKKCLTGSKVAHVRLTYLMHTQHKSKTGHTRQVYLTHANSLVLLLLLLSDKKHNIVCLQAEKITHCDVIQLEMVNTSGANSVNTDKVSASRINRVDSDEVSANSVNRINTVNSISNNRTCTKKNLHLQS